jgi:hypothetical protein
MHGYARERLNGNVLTGGSRRNGPAEGFRVNNNGAERCVLCVACRTLGVARRMLYIACMVHVVCRMAYVVWRILYADAGTSGGYASAMRLFSRRLAGTQAGARS